VSASLSFDGRMYCRVHPDVALAHVIAVDGLVCVVCRAQRAAQLERLLGAGNDFEYPIGSDRVLHYVCDPRTGP
jgi:hypothetical protein